MRNFFLSVIANWISLMLLSTLISSWIKIDSLWIALLSAIILAIFNLLVRPILIVLTLPLNILTLGLFTFVVNALILYTVSYIVPGFNIPNFFPVAIFLAIIMSIINGLLMFILRAI